MQIDLQVWFVVCLQSVVNGKLNTDRDYCFVFVSRHFKARYSNLQTKFVFNKQDRKKNQNIILFTFSRGMEAIII